MMKNQKLRQIMRKKRNLTGHQDTLTACKFISCALRTNKYFQQSKTIGIYWGIDNEIPLQKIISQLNNNQQTIYLPKTSAKDGILIFLPYKPEDEMSRDYHNIPCPKDEEFALLPQKLDLAMVPLIACNDKQFRMGYGGGFYDRSFSNATNTHLIGIGYDFQLSADFTECPHDLKLDEILLAPTSLT